MNLLQGLARRTASTVGRSSWIVRNTRPIYELILDWSTGGRGIPWAINGVTYRIDPRHRHRLGQDYDSAVATFLRERVRPGAICLDVGANIGVYVLQFCHWTGANGKVIAFEPNPQARIVLEKHIRLNGLTDRVEVISAAVGSSPGLSTLYAAGADGMSRLAEPNAALAAEAIPLTVPVVTLDEFCTARVLRPDWLFLDIEGFEIEALSGASELLRNSRSYLGIVVEMHPDVWASAASSRGRAEELLTDLRLHPVPLTGQRDPLGEHGLVFLDWA